MPRVKTGTKDTKIQVLKSTGGIRKIRCNKCGGLVTASPDGAGETQYRCNQCGNTVTFQSI